MPNQTSRIQARFAMIVLKHARLSDREIALKLIGGLAHDLPRDPTGPAARDAHANAIRHFEELADVLRARREAGPQWRAADDAMQKWLDLVN